MNKALFLLVVISSLTMGSLASANKQQVLINCTAKVLSSDQFKKPGDLVPLRIMYYEVDASSSSSGKAYRSVSFEFDNQYSFIASGYLDGYSARGHYGTLTDTTVSADSTEIFDDNGPARRLIYKFDRPTMTLHFTYRSLPIGSSKNILAQCQ